jgi:uncharacterized protein with NRDE domain
MCLILFAYKSHPRYPLVLAANRDEFHDRPTAPASFWDDSPDVLAGRDLRSGGTWLGITRKGRIAGLSNYLDPYGRRPDSPSRGSLVTAFLTGVAVPLDFLDDICRSSARFNGFSLIFGDLNMLFYHSNRGKVPAEIKPGIHGLSNHLLDTPWPKVERGKRVLTRIMATEDEPDLETIFALLADHPAEGDGLTPQSATAPDGEQLFSNLFISGPGYGTRSSTIIMIDTGGMVTFTERTYDGDRNRHATGTYRFNIEIQRA